MYDIGQSIDLPICTKLIFDQTTENLNHFMTFVIYVIFILEQRTVHTLASERILHRPAASELPWTSLEMQNLNLLAPVLLNQLLHFNKIP